MHTSSFSKNVYAQDQKFREACVGEGTFPLPKRGYFFRSSEKERGKCYMSPGGMWAPWGNTWLSYLSPALWIDLACSSMWVHWWNACTKEQLDGWWAGWLSECMDRWMPKQQSETSFGLLCQRAFLINYSSGFHCYILFWPNLGISLCSRWEKITSIIHQGKY